HRKNRQSGAVWDIREERGCAVPSSRLAEARDLDDGIWLAVSVPTPHVLAAPKFLDDDLLGLELVDNLADDPGPFDHRGADRRAALSAAQEEHLGEDEFIPGLSIAPIDLNAIAFANPELMAPVLDNGVHPSFTPATDRRRCHDTTGLGSCRRRLSRYVRSLWTLGFSIRDPIRARKIP